MEAGGLSGAGCGWLGCSDLSRMTLRRPAGPLATAALLHFGEGAAQLKAVC